MTQVKNEELNQQAGTVTIPETVEVANNNEFGNGGFSWSVFEEQSSQNRTVEAIVAECLADSKHFMLKRGLHVKNVNATVSYAKASNLPTTRYTLVVKETIPGMVKSTTEFDAFGEPKNIIGPSTNVFTSAFAFGAVMKETAKGVIWARKVSGLTAPIPIGQKSVQIDDHIANDLYAGGIIDVLCQYVPAGTPYVNPFASDPDNSTVFDEDRIFHHVVSCTFGEIGNDMYLARIAR